MTSNPTSGQYLAGNGSGKSDRNRISGRKPMIIDLWSNNQERVPPKRLQIFDPHCQQVSELTIP